MNSHKLYRGVLEAQSHFARKTFCITGIENISDMPCICPNDILAIVRLPTSQECFVGCKLRPAPRGLIEQNIPPRLTMLRFKPLKKRSKRWNMDHKRSIKVIVYAAILLR